MCVRSLMGRSALRLNAATDCLCLLLAGHSTSRASSQSFYTSGLPSEVCEAAPIDTALMRDGAFRRDGSVVTLTLSDFENWWSVEERWHSIVLLEMFRSLLFDGLLDGR